MTDPIDYDQVKAQIENLYKESGNLSREPIEQYLSNKLDILDFTDKIIALEQLIELYKEPQQADRDLQSKISIDDHVLARVIKLLLGRDISKTDFNSDELLQSLADSINTVFESLNQLISVINSTLVGNQDTDQTIRQVIGYHLEGSQNSKTLETYIGQIGKAFYESQEASKKAAHAKVRQILVELSPEKIKSDAGISQLTPLRKSKYYEVYEKKFEKFEKWFESGRFMESFIREFEKNCQKITF